MWEVEHTDTFGGEANYAWCQRHSLPDLPDVATRAQLVRAAKKACGLTGVWCRISDFGDEYHIRPKGMCQIIFITWREES